MVQHTNFLEKPKYKTNPEGGGRTFLINRNVNVNFVWVKCILTLLIFGQN